MLLTDLLTAIRRGILQNERGLLSLDCRTIEEYPRDFLKTQFLAAIGSAWIARDEAVTRIARWLGFARTGLVIAETARSLIHGLVRQGRLLILSCFARGHARATAVLAARRYLVVAALAGEHWFVCFTPGGQSERLARVIECWSPSSLA